MKNQMELKLGAPEMRAMKSLTKALNKLAVSMQLYMPQKPKNSEIRLTEPAQDETEYLLGSEANKRHLEQSVEEFN